MIREGIGPLPAEISLSDLAAVLGRSPRHVSGLAEKGIIPKNGRGNYPFAEAVRAYAAWRVKGFERQNASTSADKLHDTRAKDLALRTAERERNLIPLADTLLTFEQMSGEFLNMISGLPARITTNPRERQRLETICQEEKRRLASRFAKLQRILETGIDGDDSDEEAD